MWAALALAGALCSAPAAAQVLETSRVLAGAGGALSNALRRGVSVAAQPAPAGLTTNAARVNWSGFLQTFVLFPVRDADGDGRADENDLDDDSDGVADDAELEGRAFEPPTPTDPLTADSDGDGSADGAEAGAGTNPRDAASLLRITQIEALPDGVAVRWQSREGYRYRLLAGDSVSGLLTAPESAGEVTATGGVGPWREAASALTNAPAGSQRVYRIELQERP